MTGGLYVKEYRIYTIAGLATNDSEGSGVVLLVLVLVTRVVVLKMTRVNAKRFGF